MKIKDLADTHTQEFLQGLFILLEAYPKARIRTGWNLAEIHIRGVDDNLPPQDKELLENYGWHLVYYEDEYFWEFELAGSREASSSRIGTIND